MRREDKLKNKGHVDRRRGREEQEIDIDPRFVRRDKLITSLEPRTEAQAHYIHSIGQNTCTFGIGPAGTGKTYVCAVLAALALRDKAVSKIVITRPAMPAGEDLGFLPGEIEEKYAPYMAPFKEYLIDVLGPGMYDYCIKTGAIEPAPLAFMRGRTFKNAIVILDEAQNTTPEQMKMFLTRPGANCKLIVNGDPQQVDIKGESGLIDAVRRFRSNRRVGQIIFEREDIVRSGFVQDVVEAYETR